MSERKVESWQLQKVHAALHAAGQLSHKAQIIEGWTNGRSTSSKDLTYKEADGLLKYLNESNRDNKMNVSSKLMAKLFAMNHEMGKIVSAGQVWNEKKGKFENKKDYSAVHAWVEKFGYLKKELRQYTYKELPKLVSQFEHGPYKEYLTNLSK